MAPNIHTINDISSGPVPVPQAARSFKDRHCPGMRSCFNFDPATFNPVGREGMDRNRRIAMLVALVCHTAFEVLWLFMLAVRFNVVGLLVKTILSLIGFLFISWALSTIGEAEGERLVSGLTVTRWHFDLFLIFCAVTYLSAFLGFLLIGGSAGVSGLLPLPIWILIFVVAWIATWDANGVSLA